MKKRYVRLLMLLFLSFAVFIPTQVLANDEGVNFDVELTKEQKDELAFLHKSLMDQKIGIINKYVEFGVFTEGKGKKLIEHMEKHYKELEKNEFIPKRYKNGKKDEEEE